VSGGWHCWRLWLRPGRSVRQRRGKVLQEMEDRLGIKLTERTTGGPCGGGTQLTAEGVECVRRFRRFTAGLQDLIERRFAEAFEEA
jgi:molybdate transport repressor ModE-like protein